MCARDGPGRGCCLSVGPRGPAEMCPGNGSTQAVFNSEIFGENISVPLSLLFDKNYPTIN
jgi:hypothetical protein